MADTLPASTSSSAAGSLSTAAERHTQVLQSAALLALGSIGWMGLSPIIGMLELHMESAQVTFAASLLVALFCGAYLLFCDLLAQRWKWQQVAERPVRLVGRLAAWMFLLIPLAGLHGTRLAAESSLLGGVQGWWTGGGFLFLPVFMAGIAGMLRLHGGRHQSRLLAAQLVLTTAVMGWWWFVQPALPKLLSTSLGMVATGLPNHVQSTVCWVLITSSSCAITRLLWPTASKVESSWDWRTTTEHAELRLPALGPEAWTRLMDRLSVGFPLALAGLIPDTSSAQLELGLGLASGLGLLWSAHAVARFAARSGLSSTVTIRPASTVVRGGGHGRVVVDSVDLQLQVDSDSDGVLLRVGPGVVVSADVCAHRLQAVLDQLRPSIVQEASEHRLDAHQQLGRLCPPKHSPPAKLAACMAPARRRLLRLQVVGTGVLAMSLFPLLTTTPGARFEGLMIAVAGVFCSALLQLLLASRQLRQTSSASQDARSDSDALGSLQQSVEQAPVSRTAVRQPVPSTRPQAQS